MRELVHPRPTVPSYVAARPRKPLPAATDQKEESNERPHPFADTQMREKHNLHDRVELIGSVSHVKVPEVLTCGTLAQRRLRMSLRMSLRITSSIRLFHSVRP